MGKVSAQIRISDGEIMFEGGMVPTIIRLRPPI
jgi:hypothetical protein